MKLFEDFGNEQEYFMVTWMEGGDEIHMTLLSMEHYDRVFELIPEWYEDLSNFWNFVEDNREEDSIMIQTFCQEDFPFVDKKIVKVIHIPFN
jgi:hypothetical protein